MKKTKNASVSSLNRKNRPALTPEARESQMIALAVDLAERQLMDGSASAQVITHYLKLGTQRERLEREILAKQTALLDAKTKTLESAQRSEELFNKAIKAFRSYSGQEVQDDDDEY